jgi:hypothetical protein
MTRESKKPPLLPDAAYENAHLVAQDLLERLRELLHSLPAPGSDHVPMNWQNVGDLMRINVLLGDAIGILERRT